MNFDERALAETFVEDAAQSSARRVADGLVVAAQPARQFVERTFDGGAQDGSRGLGGGRFHYADRADRRRRQGLTATIEDQGGNGAAVERDAPTVLQGRAVERQQTLSVAGQSPDRHFVD